MYAAAGGASLASRQARQRQRQNKKLQQLKNHKESKPLQAKQYHNYTDDLAVPKLSRVERGTLLPPPPAAERRHSASNYHLKEPHRHRLRESPSISIPVQTHPPCSFVENHVSTPSLQLPQIFIPEGGGALERRCSFVRQVEEMEKCQEGGLLDRCNHLCNFEIKDKAFEVTYPEYEKDVFGSLDYPFSECSQGRAAWQERERGRRCSLSEEARQHRIKQTEAHHRWMKRNRIHDSTYGVGSDDDDFVYHQSAAANALLYVGLGTTAIGSVIFFVGTGEKGFKTLELRLIGPTLIACGLLCCLIRVLLCAIPSTCFRKKKKTRLKNNACSHASSRYPRPHEPADFHVDNAALLSKTKKKVSIVPPCYPLPSTSTQEFKEKPPALDQVVNLPQINLPEEDVDKKSPDDDSIIELQNLELVYDIESVSSNENDEVTIETETKLTRTREPANRVQDDLETCLSVVIERSDNSESSDGPKDTSDRQTHSGIVLSPSQLGQ